MNSEADHLHDTSETTRHPAELSQPSLNVGPVIERRAFEDLHVQELFTEWCDVNDSIEPVYVDREEWNRRVGEGQMLAEAAGANGKRELAIPTDLHLWEMVSVMEAVDEDTFGEGSERVARPVEKIRQLGETFSDAGTYMAQQLEVISDEHSARDIAEQLAGQFYNYGQRLLTEQHGEVASTEAIAAQPRLAPERQEKVDRWLAGDRLYEARRAQALAHDGGDADKALDNVRDWTLDQFFRVTAKSLELQGHDDDLTGETDRKTWQSVTPIHIAFPRQMEGQIAREIKKPEQELVSSVFRRGIDLLQKNMGVSSLPDDFKQRTLQLEAGETTLRGALKIDQLRAELEQLRAGEVSDFALSMAFVRACDRLASNHAAPGKTPIKDMLVVTQDYNASTGVDLNPYPKIDRVAALGILTEAEIEELRAKFSLEKAIAKKEREIADKIQLAVGQYAYKINATRPAQILQDEELNCVGFSTLGGALMQEAGLNYLVADLPQHSALVLVTSDGQVEWRDMQGTGAVQLLVGQGTSHNRADGSPITTQMVENFSRSSLNTGIAVPIPREIHQSGAGGRVYSQHSAAYLSRPEYGHEAQVLRWAGDSLEKAGNNEASAAAYRHALDLNPNDANTHVNLGVVLSRLGRFEESIEEGRAAIAIEPEEAMAYFRIGYSLSSLGRYQDALDAFQASAQLDPDYSLTHYNVAATLGDLQRTEEAIAAYETFLIKGDPKSDMSLMDSARARIAKLKQGLAP